MTAPGMIPMIQNFIDDQSPVLDLNAANNRVRNLATIVQVTQNRTQDAVDVIERALTPLQQGSTSLKTTLGTDLRLQQC